MIMYDDLTPGMQDALRATMFGVRRYPEGWRSEDTPPVTVDGRSLLALAKRGLIVGISRGVSHGLLQGAVELTRRGADILRQVGENP